MIGKRSSIKASSKIVGKYYFLLYESESKYIIISIAKISLIVYNNIFLTFSSGLAIFMKDLTQNII